jgi:hypothetical protein
MLMPSESSIDLLFHCVFVLKASTRDWNPSQPLPATSERLMIKDGRTFSEKAPGERCADRKATDVFNASLHFCILMHIIRAG